MAMLRAIVEGRFTRWRSGAPVFLLALAMAARAAWAQEPCPSAVRFDADGPATDVDLGWTGLGHDQHFTGLTLTLGIGDCAGQESPACGACTLSGPLANGGGAVFNNRRCADATWLTCGDDAECVGQGAAGPCRIFFGPPLPYSFAGEAVCITNEISGPATGTIDVESGRIEMTLPYLAKIHRFADTFGHPCPLCLDGVCDAGPRKGHACVTSGTHPLFGPVSFDCPPQDGRGFVLGQLVPSTLSLSTTGPSMTLTSASPDCRYLGFAGSKCFCDTCNDLAATACASNADCVAVGASVCGGKRCITGGNAGTPCAVNSECGTGACTRPGVTTEPNGCADGVCTPNTPPDEDSGNEGVCEDGSSTLFLCGIETFRTCYIDSDCPLAGDACDGGIKFTECFTDNGVLGASISAPGVADPPIGNTAHPTLGSLFCIQSVTTSTVNQSFGLPGPGRFTLPGTLTLAHKIVSGTLPAGGGTVMTDTEGDGATPADPLESAVTSPREGEVIIAAQATSATPPGGFTFLGEQVTVVASAAGSGDTLLLEFRIDASQVPAPENEHTLQIFKDGALVAPCAGDGAVPDPCVATRARLDDGDVVLTIRSSTASVWNVGAAAVVATPAATDTPSATPTAQPTDTPGPIATPIVTALTVRSLEVRRQHRTSGDGRIAGHGVFTALAPDVFDATAAIAVRVADGLVVDQGASWSPANCVTTQNRTHRRIKCTSPDGGAHAEFDSRARQPGVNHFRLMLRHLPLAAPFAPPATLTLTYGAPQVTRAGTISRCTTTHAALRCRDL